MIRWLLLLAAAAHAQTVQGVAVNKITHKPVAGATVQLIGIAEGADADIYRGKSDTAGHFRFPNVVPGKYRAVADAPGFTRMEYESRVPRFTVDRASPVPEITIPLTPFGIISGRVTDQDGDPVPYTSVEALQYGYRNGKKSLQRMANVRTDDRGEYRMFELLPGRYYVRAMLRAGPTMLYPPAFYPGVNDVAQASLVEALPASEAHSIDLALHPEGPHSISGRVVDGQTGEPAKGVYVTARTADGFANGGPQMADSFTIHDVAPGKYVLYAQQVSEGLTKSARLAVDLGSADLTGLQLTLAPGVDLPGTIRVGGDPPVEAAGIHLSLEGDDYNVDATVDAKGAFAFRRALPGISRLAWTLPKGYYVKSIKMGDRLLPDDRIDLTGHTAPLAIQLANDGGGVQGVVRNSSGEPVAGAVVTLTADPSYDFWSATSDEKGAFEIRDIAPGDYRLLAFGDAPEGAPQDADFRKPFEKSAVAVQVLPSTQQKVDAVAVLAR